MVFKPSDVQTRVKQAYREVDGTLTKIAVTTDPGDELNIAGSFVSSGLKTDFLITTEEITDSASTVPAGGNLTDRNAIAITNLDETETIYLGKATVTADSVNGTTSGWEIAAGETFQLDVTDAITLHARAETGKIIKIKVFEVA